MKSLRSILSLLIISFLFIHFENALSGNNKENNYADQIFIPATIKNKIQTGDIVLRNGKGFISDVFRQFSLKDKSYSHAGIISIEDDKIFVYHILQGMEQKSEVSGQKSKDAGINESYLRKELLESFCNSNNNSAYAIYRYDLSKNAKEKIIDKLESFSKKKIIFDSHFDLDTDSAMYCTELVYKAIEAASENEHYLPYSIVEGNKYIAPDNLYLNPHAALIYSRDY
ncbi:MAG: YiiX/YebB-like N1pC/P60 family cysteine hydrolase [Bacteroidota bacterium]